MWLQGLYLVLKLCVPWRASDCAPARDLLTPALRSIDYQTLNPNQDDVDTKHSPRPLAVFKHYANPRGGAAAAGLGAGKMAGGV